MDTQAARQRLLEMQQQLTQDAASLEERIEPGGDAEEGVDDFGDRGAHEQIAEENSALLQQVKDRLASVEAALARIEDGTYGVSTVSGKPIPDERLEARPDAATLVEEADDESGVPRP
jgi:DnaK suppressor protein